MQLAWFDDFDGGSCFYLRGGQIIITYLIMDLA